MSEWLLDYSSMIEVALRFVVQRTLEQTARLGLPGDHHFYISFSTAAEGVTLPDHLAAKYPEEMTIVLQHQFRDLEVRDLDFSVTLSFQGKPERVTIPFAAITDFADPSVEFRLRFPVSAPELPEAPPEPRISGEVIILEEFRRGNRPVNDGNGAMNPLTGSADDRDESDDDDGP